MPVGRCDGFTQAAFRLYAILQVFLLIMLVVANAPAFAQSASGKRVALVIGNAQYQNIPILANPVNDAELVASTLKELGFSLVGDRAQLNLTKPDLDRAIQSFGRSLLDAEAALFYYAGHGVQVRGNNYLISVDANPTREADVDFQMLDVNLALRQMKGSGSRLNLVILDACRNNPFGGRGLRSAANGLAQMQSPEGTLVSFATQPGNVALDGDGANSPFTKAFAETIKTPGLDVFRSFNEVGLKVAAATAGQQKPWFSFSPIKGEFYFSGSTGSKGDVAGKKVESATEIAKLTERIKELESLSNQKVVSGEYAFWNTVVAATNFEKHELAEEYLSKWPNGIYKRFALALLEPEKKEIIHDDVELLGRKSAQEIGIAVRDANEDFKWPGVLVVNVTNPKFKNYSMLGMIITSVNDQQIKSTSEFYKIVGYNPSINRIKFVLFDPAGDYETRSISVPLN